MIGDATYTDYGTRLYRDNASGANSYSALQHRGTGAFLIQTIEAAPIDFYTTSALRLTISAAGLATFAGDINFSQATPEILGGDADGELFVGPSTTKDLGGNLVLYGQSHASKANDIEFRATAATELGYDDSASAWNFAANALLTTGNLAVGGTVTAPHKVSIHTAPSASAISGTVTSDGTRQIQLGQSGSAYSYNNMGANQNILYTAGGTLSIVANGQAMQLITGTTATLSLAADGAATFIGTITAPSISIHNLGAMIALGVF
mgnify:FL=1